jgi:putative peptidoglycan lipid II flippase
VSKKLKNISIVSLFTVVSRFLGLARDQLSAAVFGTSIWQDAFVTAFSLPNLFRRLLGEGALTAAFVPTLQQEIQERQRAGAFAVLSNVASWLAAVSVGVVLVAMVLFSQSRRILAQEEGWYLMADLSVLLFPYLALVCVAAVLSATLNVLGRFTESALSPVWLNLSMISALGGAGLLWAETDRERMYWLCAGVLAGGVLQMIVPAVTLIRTGWRPRWDLTLSPAVRLIGRLMAPALFGVAIYQINIYVSRLIAFSLERSSATALYFANRVMELPIGIFAIAVSTVVYPLIAQHAAQRKFDEMGMDYRKGLRLILVLNVPAAAGLILLSEPITRLLFQHGRFTADDTRLMAPLLALFAIGMPFFSVVSLTTRAFYAVKDTTTPVKVAALSFAVNLGLILALKDVFGVNGLAMASTVAVIVQTLVLQGVLARRLPGLKFGELWRSLAKIGLATIAMSAGVAFGWRAATSMTGGARAADAIAILGLIPAAVVVYGSALWLLRIEGRDELAAVFAKLRAKLA